MAIVPTQTFIVDCPWRKAKVTEAWDEAMASVRQLLAQN